MKDESHYIRIVEVGRIYMEANMNYETAWEIEYVVAGYFDYLSHLIVPNIYAYSIGLHGGYEMDLVIMSSSGYLQEVEIKVSRGDLIKDADKTRWRYPGWASTKKMWFAMPEKMDRPNCAEHVPEFAGILIVGTSGKVKVTREATINKEAKPLNIKQQYKLARLGAIRIWGPKRNMVMREQRK